MDFVMTTRDSPMAAAPTTAGHSHVFLGKDHHHAERKTWAVIWLCGVMMALEVVGGLVFGSMALVADGLHMSTHAGALLLAALAYSYSRRHADDPRFSFGTGKLGDLAGFASAIVLAMISLFIGYESIERLFAPVPIHFSEAIPIATLGLLVNLASAWLLRGEDHHGHSHGAGDHGHAHDEAHRLETGAGTLLLSIFEDGVPPVFRVTADSGAADLPAAMTIETVRPDGTRQVFALTDRGAHWESTLDIPEPHGFTANVNVGAAIHTVHFEEPDHGGAVAHRDNNMRAAVVHVMADAAVSVMVILGLVLARVMGWLWMDAAAGIIGAVVIASWAYRLVRDTGMVLLDVIPDSGTAAKVRDAIERSGDRLVDLHLWRLGPGHLGAIVSVTTPHGRDVHYYRGLLRRFRMLSHVTVEVLPS